MKNEEFSCNREQEYNTTHFYVKLKRIATIKKPPLWGGLEGLSIILTFPHQQSEMK